MQSTKFKANFALVCIFSAFFLIVFLLVFFEFVFALDVVKVSLYVCVVFFL